MSNIIKSGGAVRIDKTVLLPDLPMPLTPPIPIEVDEEKLSPHDLYKHMLGKAQSESERIFSEMNAAAKAEREGMLEDAAQEIEELRREAAENGYRDAYEGKSAELESLMNEIKKTINGVHITLDTYMRRYERELPGLALGIAEKVIVRKLEEDDHVLIELCRAALSTVRSEGYVTVEVSERLPGLAAKLRRELTAKDYYGMHIDVKAKDLPEDSCIIQTQEGVVDASVSEQIQNLKELFAEQEDIDV